MQRRVVLKLTLSGYILSQQGRWWTGLFCWANFPVLEDGWAPPCLALTDVRQVASLALRPPLASKKRPNRIPGLPPGSFLKMPELFTIWMDDRGQEKLGVVARDCADSIPDHCSGLTLFSALALIDILLSFSYCAYLLPLWISCYPFHTTYSIYLGWYLAILFHTT